VDKERGVILEERRLRRDAQGRLLDAIIPAALPGSPYAQRLPIGSENTIKTVTPKTLERYYHDWYRPDLMAVIVVGDLDTKAIETRIQQWFGDLAARTAPRRRPAIVVPPHDKPVTLAVKDPELPVTIVAVASKQPHRTVRSEGGYRSEFIDELFTAMLNQRLNELARKPEASFLAAAVGRQPILRPIDVWFQGAVVKNERTEYTTPRQPRRMSMTQPTPPWWPPRQARAPFDPRARSTISASPSGSSATESESSSSRPTSRMTM
jgi:zinc protease